MEQTAHNLSASFIDAISGRSDDDDDDERDSSDSE